MTGRGLALLLTSVALAVAGFLLRWPEATGLGAAGATLVLLGVALGLRRVHADLSVERTALRVTRGEAAAVRVTVAVPRRRRGGLRLVDGPVARPLSTMRLPRPSADGRVTLAVPIDATERGQWVAGPYTLVQGDPWGVVQRVAGQGDAGTVTVHPPTHPVRRSILTSKIAGESESASRRFGDEHFHALREYVLGDEPRIVHWRSSARAGRLMVRQQVAAATSGTTIILDTDLTAYVSERQFAASAEDERFEVAVEVAASVAAAQATTEQVHLMVTTAGTRITSAAAGSTNSLLDVLAVVQPVAPVSTAPEQLPAAVRRTRCARVVLVSGTPGQKTLQALAGVSKVVPATLLIRVGSTQAAAVATSRVLDVLRGEDLS